MDNEDMGEVRTRQILSTLALPPVANPVDGRGLLGGSGPKDLDDGEWPAPVMAVIKQTPVTAEGNNTDVDTRIRSSSNSSGSGLREQNGTSSSSPCTKQRKDRRAIERGNLLAVCKIVVKELIDLSLSHGRSLEDSHEPLQQFLVIMENVLLHGAKVSRPGLLRTTSKDCWTMIEQLSKTCQGINDICLSIRDMSNIKTGLGKLRAWLRLSLMQKSLADYFRVLVDKRDEILMDYYEPGAVMLGEESVVITGLLVGINIIDCNMALKDDADLDRGLGTIDYSLYLKEIVRSSISSEEDLEQQQQQVNESADKMAAILDQKNYLEELNRRLTATVSSLNQKVDAMQATASLAREEAENARLSLVEVQQENSLLRCENMALTDGHQRQLETARQDIQIERDTYQQSRQGLDILYQEAKKKLQDETQMRLDVEKELQLQINMRQEIEIAKHMLEKDSQEKQELTCSLRKQLDEVKNINIENFSKLQSAEKALQHKNDLVNRLEVKSGQMVNTIRDMEDALQRSANEKQAADETARKVGLLLAERDNKRSALETDLKVEREWRGSLQKNLEQEKAQWTKLNAELKHLTTVKKDYDTLQSKYLQLQQLCEEQEKALAELGSHLSQSKLKMEDYKEAQLVMKDAQWAVDKEAAQCRQCTKPFSVSRRKHHCRNCGEIFCNDCSNTKMPLPSSAKPVRVCDACNNLLLQRYAVN